MNKIKRITKCESIAKMTNDEVKIMILQQKIDKAIEYIDNQEWVDCEECVNQVYDILKGSEKMRDIINDLQRIADRRCYPEDILDGSIAQYWVDILEDNEHEIERLNNTMQQIIEYIEYSLKNNSSGEREVLQMVLARLKVELEEGEDNKNN